MGYSFKLKFLIRSFAFKIKGLQTQNRHFDCMCAGYPKKSNNCKDCSVSIHKYFFESVTYARNFCEIENEIYNEKINIIREVAPIIISAQMSKNTLQRREALLKIGEEKFSLYHEALLALKLMVKHPGFAEEQEIRFGCVNTIDGLNNSCHKSIIKNSAPRLEIDFYLSAIKKIIIGPQDRQTLKKNIIQHLLDELSVGDIEVIESSIPYRQIR